MPQSFPDARPRPLQSPTDRFPVITSIMFQDAPRHKLSVNHRIFLMSTLLVLCNLALTIAKNSRVYLFEQAQCFLYYQSHDATKIDPRNGIEEKFCKEVDIQLPLSIVMGVDSCFSLLPALLVLATYEQLLPRLGLRYLCLINIFSGAIGVIFSTFIFWTHHPWATYVAPFSWAFDLIGGGDIVRVTIVTTCIAEIAPPEQLTKIYNYTNAFYLLAGMGGAAFGSLLLSKHVYLLNGLSVLSFAFTAWFALLIPHSCGQDLKAGEDTTPILDSLEDPASPPLLPQRPAVSSEAKYKLPILEILLYSWYTSYRSIVTLFQTPNPTFTVILVYLINGLAMNIQVLLPQYTSLVLRWPFEAVNAALALKSLISALVLLALPTFRRIYMEPRMTAPHIDLLITQVSLLANMIGMVGLGLSASAWLFIISLSIFTSGVGLVDSLCSFGTVSLSAGETVPDFYLRLGLIQVIAGLVAAPIWSWIFSLVLKTHFFLGLPFWLCAGLFGSGIAGTSALKKWYTHGF